MTVIRKRKIGVVGMREDEWDEEGGEEKKKIEGGVMMKSVEAGAGKGWLLCPRGEFEFRIRGVKA